MNRLRLHTIKLIAEVNPHFFKTAEGQDSLHQSVNWINESIKRMRTELIDAADQARVFVHVDKFPRYFALPQHLPPRMRHPFFINILSQFTTFERFHTAKMKTIGHFLTDANLDVPTDTMPEENDSHEALQAVYNNILAVAEQAHQQLDQFDQLLKDIQKHAKLRYRLIASFNKPFNPRLTEVYTQILSFKTSCRFNPYLTENNADDLNTAKADFQRTSKEARQVRRQTEPKKESKASDTQFDYLENLVKEFNDLCMVEEQKFSQAQYNVADPTAAGLKPVRENLNLLAKLHDEFKALNKTNLEPNLYERNSTLLVANMAQLVLSVSTLLKALHQLGLTVFEDANDFLPCIQIARYGFAHALLTQDLAKIHFFVNWIVTDLKKAVDSRYYQGRKFQPISSEQMPRELQQFTPSNGAPDDVNACLVDLDHLNQRIASLVHYGAQLETTQAPELEKSQVAVALVFALAKAGLLVKAITVSQGQFRVIPRDYSDATQEFIGIYNPTQRQSFFAACSSRRTTPLLTYLDRNYHKAGGGMHCMMLIDQMTKKDVEIALQEFVNMHANLPSDDWTSMTPHVRALVKHIARKHIFAQTELGPSFTNNMAQATLVHNLPREASQAYFNLIAIMPTIEIGDFDFLNRQLIQCIYRVLWDLSHGQFSNVFIDVYGALGYPGDNMLGFMNQYAVTPDQKLVMEDIYRILVSLVTWKSLTDDAGSELRLQ